MSILSVTTLLKQMVAIPSLSHEERVLADYMETYVRQSAVAIERFEDNLFFWIGDGSHCLLLNTHLDVVPPSEQHPYGPFTPTEVDGKLYGRGTVDAKASGAAMTTAILQLAAAGWQPPNGKVLVALTVCEEVGGTTNGLQRSRLHLPEIHAALIGEPTHMQPCLAQKGLLILRIEAKGTSAHAARAHLGDNAIYRAVRDIQRLEHYTFTKADPFLGTPTLCVTVIDGGKARNIVPDVCTFYVDIRSTPAYTHEELIEEIDALLESEVHVHSKRLIPVGTQPDASIAQACKRALPDAEFFGSPTLSDWIFLHDVPTVKIGPGSSKLSHTADEHIDLHELDQAVSGYQAIIKAYFEQVS